MRTQSTNGADFTESFFDAVSKGVPSDGGVFVPSGVDPIPRAFFMNIHRMTHPEICFVVARYLLGDEVDSTILKNIVYSAYDFPLPIKELDSGLYTFDLSYVPSGSYMQQVGVFSSRLIAQLRKDRGDTRKVTVLIFVDDASGPLLARMFSLMPTVTAVCLFPQSSIPNEIVAEMKDMGSNIYPLEIHGTVSDCKRIMFEAFHDKELTDSMFINVITPTNPVIVFTRVFQFFQAYARFVAHRKAQNKIGNSILGQGLVFFIPASMQASIQASRIAIMLGLPDSRFVVWDSAVDPDPSSLLSNGEFGILIPEVNHIVRPHDIRHLPVVDHIPATYPALKRFILNLKKTT